MKLLVRFKDNGNSEVREFNSTWGQQWVDSDMMDEYFDYIREIERRCGSPRVFLAVNRNGWCFAEFADSLDDASFKAFITCRSLDSTFGEYPLTTYGEYKPIGRDAVAVR